MNINKSDGWIKLHKKIIFSDLVNDHNAFRLFTFVLLMAHHEDNQGSVRFNGKQVYLKKGQLSMSRKELADKIQLSPSTTRNALNRLKEDSRVDIKSDNKTSIITICKWSEYQYREDSERTAKRTTRGQREDSRPLSQKNKEIKNIVSKDTRSVSKLYYDYLKKYRVPITNHNVLRNKIKEMEKLHGIDWCVRYLNFMLNEYEQVDVKYKPEINDALDLFRKAKNIETRLIKEKEKERIY